MAISHISSGTLQAVNTAVLAASNIVAAQVQANNLTITDYEGTARITMKLAGHIMEGITQALKAVESND